MKCHGLVILAEMIPLSAPLMVLVEPTNRCNFKCAYCPTGDNSLLNKAHPHLSGDMSFEFFKKIVDDMNAFLPAKIKRVQLFKDGEPLLHPKIIEMIKYAKASPAITEVDTTTNASLLDYDMAEKIVLAKLDSIRISFEGTVLNEEYQKITRSNYTYDGIKHNLYLLAEAKNKHKSRVPYIEAKLIDTGLSLELKGKFTKDFSGIADEVIFDPLVDRKGGSGRVLKGEKELLPAGVCPVPFYGLAVNFNGTVCVCCGDWGYATLVGDLNQESLYDIWHGDRLHAFRKMHVEFRKSEHPLCGKCEYMRRLPWQSNIDQMSLENPQKILRRLQKVIFNKSI